MHDSWLMIIRFCFLLLLSFFLCESSSFVGWTLIFCWLTPILSGKTCFFPSFDPIFQDFQTKLSPDTPGGFNQRSRLSTMAGRSRAQYRYWVDFLGEGGAHWYGPNYGEIPIHHVFFLGCLKKQWGWDYYLPVMQHTRWHRLCHGVCPSLMWLSTTCGLWLFCFDTVPWGCCDFSPPDVT